MAPPIALLWFVCAFGASGAQGDWYLTLEVTGGVAGVDRRLDLANTGKLEVFDRRQGLHSLGRAPSGELARIATLVTALKPVDAARPRICADCFNYALRVEAEGRVLVFNLNDLSMSGASVEPLLRALTRLLNGESPQPPDARPK